MTRRKPGLRRPRRSGAAIVELAILLPIFAILLAGVWEVGRMLEVKQVLNNAAREAARQASVGTVIHPFTGAITHVYVDSEDDVPNLKDTVIRYLEKAGLNTDGVQVFFANKDDGDKGEPYDAEYLNHLEVRVTMPFKNNRWYVTDLFSIWFPIDEDLELEGKADWLSMKDQAIVIDDDLPL